MLLVYLSIFGKDSRKEVHFKVIMYGIMTQEFVICEIRIKEANIFNAELL